MLHIIISFLAISIITCNEFEFNLNDTTNEFLDNFNQNNYINDSETTITRVNSHEDIDRLYTNDVISAIKKQKWLRSEQRCVDDILIMIYNVKNTTLWALWSKYKLLYLWSKV